MSPSEDAALLLQIVARHRRGLELNLDPAYPDEEWGFAAQQCVEKLLKALIVLDDRRPPLSHDLRALALLAGVPLENSLLSLQTYAVEARYEAGPFPLSAPRAELLHTLLALQNLVEDRIAAFRPECADP